MLYINFMDRVFGLSTMPLATRGSVLTIGNFDGVHRGHQKLIESVISKSQELKLKAGLLTFDPHPVKVLFPSKQLKSIFDLEDRMEQAEKLGLDFMVIEPFSRELSELKPEDFVYKVLVERLNVKALFIGHDFSFGKDRKGNPEELKVLCKKYKIELTVLNPVTEGDMVISSTVVRDLILQGQVKRAQSFLGRNFYLKGIVEKGAGRGRKIGFPTANMFTQSELFPKIGVYASKTEVCKKNYWSVTNVGQNPTFQEKTRHPIQVETHILDFDQDIYGEMIKVEFLEYLRAEQKFGSVEELVRQIKRDIESAKKEFK